MVQKFNSKIIHGFSSALLWNKFDTPAETPQFHFELWDLMCSEESHVAVAAPRHHAKSTSVTFVFILACVLFKIKRYVLIISDTEGQAIEFLGDIKRELIENEELRQLFGIVKLSKDTENDVRCILQGGHEFRIKAFGSGNAVRGRKWRNMRPDLVVCDDMENDEMVMNEERRHKFSSWFMNALLEVGGEGCWYRAVGTILHQDSMLAKITPSTMSPTVQTDGLRYWEDDFYDRKGWKSVTYDAHNDDFTKILWPEKYTKEYFMAKRQRYIAQGNPEGYSQEHRNRPIDESLAYFRKEDMLPIKDYDEYLEYYAAGDLAISTKDQRAYSALVVVGLSAKGVLKVVDVRRFRGDSLAISTELFSVQRRWNPQIFALEKENISRSIGPFLYEQMGKDPDHPYINIKEMPLGNQDKIKRARGIQARTRAGTVEFDTKASWWPEFQEELIYFPRGTYADQVDAFAWIGILLGDLSTVPSLQERIHSQYVEEKENSYLDKYALGACEITGY